LRLSVNAAFASRPAFLQAFQGKFESCDRTTENRGVPGSSPGLATSRVRNPAWLLDSLVVGRMGCAPEAPVHETVVVSPIRVTSRDPLQNAW
jgi:hypothetical protein